MTRVTLTFDNGPTPGVTDQVLTALDAWAVPATFFLIGRKLADPQARALAERARAAGHAIGNHTMNHGTPLGEVRDPETERSEIAEAQRALGELSDPRKLFRPNGRGFVGKHLLGPSAKQHLIDGGFTVALWSVFVGDGQQPEGWELRVWDELPKREWSVVVVHDYHSGMKQLPAFLERCLDAGVEFVRDFPSDCIPLDRGVPADWLDEISGSVEVGR